MPRISTRTILQAHHHHPLLPLLLKECRSLELAGNELRWLRERALHVTEARLANRIAGGKCPVSGWRGLLRSMCLTRSRGVPLQYILGDQPFGDLDIKCARGVLIPRHETEAITFHAAKVLLGMWKHHYLCREERTVLRIIDLCTGTGCIPLLLHALLSPHFSQLSIAGIDISAAAVRLAKENTARNVRLRNLSDRALSEIHFRQGDILNLGRNILSSLQDKLGNVHNTASPRELECDVLISNPPYISPKEYRDGTTSRSVRKFEPKLALVPPGNTVWSAGKKTPREDLFYLHIIALIPCI
ncbi:S-adenosyl-L-methionine-dependent methyltransferase, partial [Aspergillus egyptiacus]